ncbi:MAG: hypothetical protein OXD43_05165 [Bacteroidetes bacterium]|nr:hypothetical protein [Bacteroidota bacterium]
MKRIFTVIVLVGALFFALCAYWQLNDPDALWWVAAYAAAALAGFAAILNRLPWQLAALFALAALGFGLYYIWLVVSQNLHYFEDETGREMMGSLMIFIYMLILTRRARLNRN